MKKRYRFRKNGSLAIFPDGDGISIWGNREGLLSFADFVKSVAEMDYDQYGLSHNHFGFAHNWEILAGKIVMQIGRKPLIAATKKRDGSGQDLTVGLARAPKKYFRKKGGA